MPGEVVSYFFFFSFFEFLERIWPKPFVPWQIEKALWLRWLCQPPQPGAPQVHQAGIPVHLARCWYVVFLLSFFIFIFLKGVKYLIPAISFFIPQVSLDLARPPLSTASSTLRSTQRDPPSLLPRTLPSRSRFRDTAAVFFFFLFSFSYLSFSDYKNLVFRPRGGWCEAETQCARRCGLWRSLEQWREVSIHASKEIFERKKSDFDGEKITSSWEPILKCVEERYDAYLDQERRVNRKHIVDNRVHCCLYFVSPTGHKYVCFRFIFVSFPLWSGYNCFFFSFPW